MSAQAIAGTGMPPDVAAASERVRQLQTLIAQASQASSPTFSSASALPATTPGTAPGFAEALQTATAASAPSGSSGAYDSMIASAAARYGIDPAILHGLIQQESGFDPNATSSAGAMGLTQLMPGTASSLGVANPLDPSESIEGGARYLSQMLGDFSGNVNDALAAYNAGPGAVKQYGGVPPYPETQDYVTKVLGYAEAYRQSHPSASGVA